MKREDLKLVIVVLALILGTAGALGYVQSNRKMGKPGLKLVQEPTLNPEGKKLRDESVYLPSTVPGLVSSNVPIQDLEFNFLPKDTTYGRRFYKDTQEKFEALASVVLMGTDRTSIHKPQYCLAGQGWHIEKSEVDSVSMTAPSDYDLPVMKLTTSITVLDKDGLKQRYSGVYVYWFVSEDQLTASHGERMWLMSRDLLLSGTLKRWAYVTYFAVCHPGEEKATFVKLSDIIRRTVPEFQLVPSAKTDAPSVATVPKTL